MEDRRCTLGNSLSVKVTYRDPGPVTDILLRPIQGALLSLSVIARKCKLPGSKEDPLQQDTWQRLTNACDCGRECKCVLCVCVCARKRVHSFHVHYGLILATTMSEGRGSATLHSFNSRALPSTSA